MHNQSQLLSEYKKKEANKEKEIYKSLNQSLESQRKKDEKLVAIQKKKKMEEINNENQALMDIKQRIQEEERERDKMFHIQQMQSIDHPEVERKKHISKIAGILHRQSIQEKAFKKTVNKKDQHSFIEYKELIPHENEEVVNTRKKQQKSEIAKILESQIKESKAKESKTIEDKKAYGEYLKASTQLASVEEMKRANIIKEVERKYAKALTSQIEEHHKLKKYQDVMTDHEIRVNRKDLELYKQRHCNEINSILPGIYPHKQYTIFGQRKSVATGSNNKSMLYQSESQKYIEPNIMRMPFYFQKPDSFSVKKLKNNIGPKEKDEHEQHTIENKNDPILLQQRISTTNKSYGYFSRQGVHV